VYQVLNPRELLRLRGRRIGPKVARNVVLLGLVSLFTDISSEMVATVLPLYLVYTLGFTPLQFGIVDGLQQGAAALARVARRLSDVSSSSPSTIPGTMTGLDDPLSTHAEPAAHKAEPDGRGRGRGRPCAAPGS
jgi:hypothetical protein